MAVVVLSHGVSQPSAIAGAVSVNPALAGSAAGLMGFGQGLIAAGGAQLVGMLQNGTVHPLFAVVTAFAVVSLLACFLARWGEAREAPPAPDAADRGARAVPQAVIRSSVTASPRHICRVHSRLAPGR